MFFLVLAWNSNVNLLLLILSAALVDQFGVHLLGCGPWPDKDSPA